MNEQQSFEVIKNVDQEGREYWSARDLGPLLDYKEWLNFQNVISKAAIACEASGQQVSDHFVESNKMVEVGQKVRQTIKDLGGTMPESLPSPDKSIQQLEIAAKSKDAPE